MERKMKAELKILATLLFLILLLLFTENSFSQGWVQLNSGTTSNLSLIQFLDANTGFVATPLLRTTNGGSNWTTINTPATPTGIFFPDLNNGYFSTGDPQGGGTIYKTTNAGLNWTNLNVSSYNLTQSIYFFNKDTGYCVGILAEIKVYKTTDGGNSWNQIGYTGIYDDWYSVYDFFFINQNEGYMRIGHYQQVNWPPTYDEDILQTGNGGQGWGVILSTPPVLDETSFFIDISIPQSSSGFVIKGPLSGIDSILYYNGTFAFQGSNYLNGIDCPDPAHAYAVGNSGTIYATTNTGTYWFSQNSNVSIQLNKPYFVNSQTGYIVGNNGTILKTVTGGEIPYTISGQIRFQDNNQPVNMGCVKALKYDRVLDQIITVDSTNIQSNGNYSMIHIPQDSLYIMAFENDEAQLVFVPTYYPSTTNWQNATVLYPTGNLTNIDVLVYRINNTGGPYHIGGHVYTYSDNPFLGLNNAIVYAKAGSDYKSYSISNNAGLYRVDSLVSSNYTLSVDRIGYAPINRTVLISNYSKDTVDITFNLVGIVQKGKDIPKSYVLGNNYPNPFNPTTKISFGLPQASNTKLIIYNILGSEVAVLIDEKLESGNYNIEWNASNYSSGVYFYKIESGDFVQTKKMVLIK